MENDVQENKLKLSIEYVNEDSNNSVDDDNFQTSAKLITLNQMGLSTEKVQTNPKKKLSKKIQELVQMLKKIYTMLKMKTTTLVQINSFT